MLDVIIFFRQHCVRPSFNPETPPDVRPSCFASPTHDPCTRARNGPQIVSQPPPVRRLFETCPRAVHPTHPPHLFDLKDEDRCRKARSCPFPPPTLQYTTTACPLLQSRVKALAESCLRLVQIRYFRIRNNKSAEREFLIMLAAEMPHPVASVDTYDEPGRT